MKLTEVQHHSIERIKARLNSGEYNTEHVRCFCGSDEPELISEKDRHGIPSRTLLCKRCGLIYVSPRMTEETLQKFYNEEFIPLYTSSYYRTEKELFQIQRKQGFHVAEWLGGHGIREKGRVFDVGCGTGGMLSSFADLGWDVAGIDFSDRLVEFGRRTLGDRLFTGDISSLEHMEPADLVLMSHVIEHVSNLKKFLLQLRKIVKPGGISLVITPGVRTFGVRILGLKPSLLNMHLTYFSLGTLTMVMGTAGLSLQVGDESIFALFRKEKYLSETLKLPGDPEISGFLQMSRKLRPLWMALWPAWKARNGFLAWKRNRNSRI